MGRWLECASTRSFLMQIVESDKTPSVDCSSSVREMEMLKLDETGLLNRSKDKEPGDLSYFDVWR